MWTSIRGDGRILLVCRQGKDRHLPLCEIAAAEIAAAKDRHNLWPKALCQVSLAHNSPRENLWHHTAKKLNVNVRISQ